MSIPVTVSARIAAIIHALAADCEDADPDAILAEVGIATDVLEDPDARITLAQEDALWNAMAAACQDPLFGLRAAVRIPHGAFGAIEYVTRSAETWGDAMRNLVRYNQLIHDVAVLELERTAEGIRLTHRFRGHRRGASLHAIDFTFATIVELSGQLVGAPSREIARHVSFRHPKPNDSRPYREVFGVTPEFGARADALTFPASLESRAVLNADPALQEVMRRHADHLMSVLPEPESDLVERVRETIWSCLNQGEADLASVASRLHMSVRTLQRRLRHAGTSFTTLRRAMRREAAQVMLREQSRSVAEIAWLLGYSEPSAFHRAFKRWTGESPARWRTRQREGRDRD